MNIIFASKHAMTSLNTSRKRNVVGRASSVPQQTCVVSITLSRFTHVATLLRDYLDGMPNSTESLCYRSTFGISLDKHLEAVGISHPRKL